jgi:hypothetical protein
MAIQMSHSRLCPVAAAQKAATAIRQIAVKNHELWIRTNPTMMADRTILIPFSTAEAWAGKRVLQSV